MGRMKLVREGNKEWDKAPANAGAFTMQWRVGRWDIMWENGRKKKIFSNYVGFAYSVRLQNEKDGVKYNFLNFLLALTLLYC